MYEMYNSYKYPLLQTESGVKDILNLVLISLSPVVSKFDFLMQSIED